LRCVLIRLRLNIFKLGIDWVLTQHRSATDSTQRACSSNG
jgi:hypothetical protein